MRCPLSPLPHLSLLTHHPPPLSECVPLLWLRTEAPSMDNSWYKEVMGSSRYKQVLGREGYHWLHLPEIYESQAWPLQNTLLSKDRCVSLTRTLWMPYVLVKMSVNSQVSGFSLRVCFAWKRILFTSDVPHGHFLQCSDFSLFFFNLFLLEYGCFTMLHELLLHSLVNQLHIYIYMHICIKIFFFFLDFIPN